MKIRRFADLDWITGEGHAAQTNDIERVSGNLRKISILANAVTANPTFDVVLYQIITVDEVEYTNQIASFSTLADGTLHLYHSRTKEYDADADFDEVYFDLDNLRISVDPSADAGGADQTLTVTVKLYFD